MARPRKAAVKNVEEVVVAETVEAAEVKAEEAVVEEVAVEEVKKAPAKKAAAKEETAEEVKKAPAKKTAAKKVVNANVMVEFNGQSVSTDLIVENIKKAFEAEGNKLSAIKDFQVYVKPEDNAAYYVINQDITGKVNLF